MSLAGAFAREEEKETSELPRLGFVGVGWIGRNRMEALAESGHGEIVSILEPAAELRDEALKCYPQASVSEAMDDMLDQNLDGIVIATPSAMHAEQSIRALEAGMAVFSQKPVGRDAKEVRKVISAAEKADRLFSADFSYRYTEAIQCIRRCLSEGKIGEVYSAELTFHNAYGPDKPWFYDPKLSGGGCMMDLGVHLIDLSLWLTDFPEISEVRSRLYARGKRLRLSAPQKAVRALAPGPALSEVEDHAWAELQTEDGRSIQLTCSWNLPAGCDAVIRVCLYGTKGALCMDNVNGSFYDFTAERIVGNHRERLCSPPDAWGGRALIEWARRLSRDRSYDPSAREFVHTAEVLDRIYQG